MIIGMLMVRMRDKRALGMLSARPKARVKVLIVYTAIESKEVISSSG